MIDQIALDELKSALNNCGHGAKMSVEHDATFWEFDLDLLRNLLALASNDAVDPATVEEAYMAGYRQGIDDAEAEATVTIHRFKNDDRRAFEEWRKNR